MNEATHYDLTGPNGSDQAEAMRRQRNLLIGLSIGSALVLVLGVVAVVLARGDSDERVGATSAPATSAPADSVSSTTPSTSTTTTSTTTTSTTTTTAAPIPGLADAGPDLAVDVGGVVTLQAASVTEGAGDDDVMWVQTGGPDVTAGVGALGGLAASFGAPDDVLTLTFDLVVSAPASEQAVDSIVVRVFEQADTAIFVDGNLGDDAGADGSVFAPYRTIGAAVAAASGGADVYVRSGPIYSEPDTLQLGPGTSLYGGFVEDWFRDVRIRAEIDAAPRSIVVAGDGDRNLSALEVVGRDAEPGADAIVVRIDDAETVTIADSRLVAGAAGDGQNESGTIVPAGVSVGVLATGTGEVRVERSTLGAGRGGSGAAASPSGVADPAEDGADASGIEGGSGAAGDDERQGGDGGGGGVAGAGNDATGSAGGAGGTDPLDDGEPGSGGAGGDGGRGGDGGVGTTVGSSPVPVGTPGSAGSDGSPGIGAGGGGGGAAGFGLGLATGGGGGGGGAGGESGIGGAGGGGGGSSVGIAAFGVNRIVVVESLVAAGLGGSGGAGGGGGAGGDGGAGGAGEEGGEDVAVAGDGGGGGGGGAGGAAGTGGGGAGAPSFGLLTDGVGEVIVTDSTLRGGGGGAGANGGGGGAAGAAGADGVGRTAGVGGDSGGGARAAGGEGASGGASSGWLDAGAAAPTLDGADLVDGTAGPAGRGSAPGDDGVETTSTTG